MSITPETVRHPFGTASTAALTASGAQAITISNDVTVIDGETVPGTAARTLNLTIAAGVNVGAKIYVIHKTAGSFGIIAGTGMRQNGTLAGSAGTWLIGYTYTGTTFDHSEGEQIA